MKKIFLIFGMAAFCSASAQQKGVFDINRHLKGLLDKKNTRATVIMPPEINMNFIGPANQPAYKLLYSLPNGDKVYVSNWDNMPCVIPGTIPFIMPNVSSPNEYFWSPLFKNNVPGTIPNAVKPYKLIASE
jgi:hypothetical protein